MTWPQSASAPTPAAPGGPGLGLIGAVVTAAAGLLTFLFSFVRIFKVDVGSEEIGWSVWTAQPGFFGVGTWIPVFALAAAGLALLGAFGTGVKDKEVLGFRIGQLQLVAALFCFLLWLGYVISVLFSDADADYELGLGSLLLFLGTGGVLAGSGLSLFAPAGSPAIGTPVGAPAPPPVSPAQPEWQQPPEPQPQWQPQAEPQPQWQPQPEPQPQWQPQAEPQPQWQSPEPATQAWHQGEPAPEAQGWQAPFDVQAEGSQQQQPQWQAPPADPPPPRSPASPQPWEQPRPAEPPPPQPSPRQDPRAEPPSGGGGGGLFDPGTQVIPGPPPAPPPDELIPRPPDERPPPPPTPPPAPPASP